MRRRNPKNLIAGIGNRTLLFARRHIPALLLPGYALIGANPSIDRPIFLLGLQGGGLTLLARMLRRHPLLVSASGGPDYWAGPDEIQNIFGAFLPPSLSGISHNKPEQFSRQNTNWLYATDRLLPFYRKTGNDASREIEKRFKQAIGLPLALFGQQGNQSRFIDKSQSFTVKVSFIAELLRGCRPNFILVTRNPYVLCYRSARKVRTFRDMDAPFEEKLRLAAQHWRNSIQAAVDDSQGQNKFIQVRFEDLLEDPVATLKQICSFCELDFDPNMLPAQSHRFPLGSTGKYGGDKKWYPIRPDVNLPYLEALEPWMIELLDKHLAGLAGRFNYSHAGP